ncbi:MAG: SDR family oxidoreductase [Acidimicrobiales bacterium]|nr:SDR family oxidoreductase [Acidimicrobiales bacterium]
MNIIKEKGGSAEAFEGDAVQEADTLNLFEVAKTKGQLRLAIYNTGNNTPGKIIDMDASYFEDSWRVCCYGGFLFAKEALRQFKTRNEGVLLFTGASASLRGRANFGAFNSSKAALRTLAQAIAKEYGPEGVHVGHVVVDGPIGGEKIMTRFPEYADKLGEDGMIDIEGIVDAYVYLYNQPKNAWSFEVDMRTSIENW